MKKILALLFIVASMFTLSGCGTQEDNYTKAELNTMITQMQQDIDELEMDLEVAQAEAANNDLLVMALIEDDFYNEEEINDLLDEYYTKFDVDNGLNEWHDEIIQTLEDFEDSQLTPEEKVTYFTLAMVNIEIEILGWTINERGTPQTEEEGILLDLLITIRDGLENDLDID